MLRTYAATYVSLQENLTNGEKISIIKWIKEAKADEIKSLLVTGDYIVEQDAIVMFDNTIVGVLLNELPVDPGVMGFKGLFSANSKFFTGVVDMDKLNDVIDQLVQHAEATGTVAGLHIGTAIGAIGGIAVGLAASAVVALVIVVAERAYKRFLSKAARACSKFKGDQKTSCMTKFRQEATKRKITDLQKGMKSCRHTKKPDKCKQKIDSKMRKLRAQLGTL